jgi:ATP-dependent Clp protease ATP-binding subunit ClpC
MDERFTTGALESLNMAYLETLRLGHLSTGLETLLLGLIAGSGNIVARASNVFRPTPTEPPVASKILKSMGVNLTDARVEVEKVIGRGTHNGNGCTSYTPSAKRLVETSCWHEAKHFGVNYIATTHLLLALIKEKEGEDHALVVLKHLGVDLAELEQQLIKAQSGVESEGVPRPKLDDLGLGQKVKCTTEQVTPEGYVVSVESVQPKGFLPSKFRNYNALCKPDDTVDARFRGDSEQMIPQFQMCDKDEEAELEQYCGSENKSQK